MKSKCYWLMKTEPDVFSFDDLLAAPHRTTAWEGVRNYQARNFMRDQFKLGDEVFIYHSSTDVPAIIGVGEVVREAYPDLSALDPKSPYYDPASKKSGESRWMMVDVQAKFRFRQPISLTTLRETKGLESMALLQRGQRLSIQPVDRAHWNKILKMGSR